MSWLTEKRNVAHCFCQISFCLPSCLKCCLQVKSRTASLTSAPRCLLMGVGFASITLAGSHPAHTLGIQPTATSAWGIIQVICVPHEMNCCQLVLQTPAGYWPCPQRASNLQSEIHGASIQPLAAPPVWDQGGDPAPEVVVPQGDSHGSHVALRRVPGIRCPTTVKVTTTKCRLHGHCKLGARCRDPRFQQSCWELPLPWWGLALPLRLSVEVMPPELLTMRPVSIFLAFVPGITGVFFLVSQPGTSQ